MFMFCVENMGVKEFKVGNDLMHLSHLWTGKTLFFFLLILLGFLFEIISDLGMGNSSIVGLKCCFSKLSS